MFKTPNQVSSEQQQIEKEFNNVTPVSSLILELDQKYSQYGDAYSDTQDSVPVITQQIKKPPSKFPLYALSCTNSSKLRAVAPKEVPQLTSELKAFLEKRSAPYMQNTARINQALFDRDHMVISDIDFLRKRSLLRDYKYVNNDFSPKEGFIKNDHLFSGSHFYTFDSLICPAIKEIPNQPILVPNKGAKYLMVDFTAVETHSKNQGIWDNGFYENPIDHKRGPISDLRPAYGNQSMIDRLVIRLYQFRHEVELSQATDFNEKKRINNIAIERFRKVYRKTHTDPQSNDARLQCATLSGGIFQSGFSASIDLEILIPFVKKDFIMMSTMPQELLDNLEKLRYAPNDLTAFRSGERYELASHYFEKNPWCEKTIAYDAQVLIEKLINIKQEKWPEIVREQKRNTCTLF